MPTTEEGWTEFWKTQNRKRKEYAERAFQRRQDKYRQSDGYFLSLIRPSNQNVNCFKYAKNNTPDHEMMKFFIYTSLMDEGYKVITEAIFASNNSRADIIDLTRGIVFEVLASETLEEAKEKVKVYPQCFEFRFIDAKKPFDIKDLL